MPNFAILADCSDPVVRVDQAHLEQADTYVDALLAGRSIDLDSQDPSETGWRLLRDLAVAYASHQAAVDGANSEASVLWRKADAYKARYLALAHRVSRDSMGIDDSDSDAGGYASAPLGRA